MPDSVRPIFVGGTGRSGTTIVARLIGAHPRYHLVPIELQVHAAPGGLSDAVTGAVSLEWLLPHLGRYWFSHPAPGGGARGLVRICSRERYDDLLAHLQGRFVRDPAAAAALFVTGLVEPLQARAGKEQWVEMTPLNIEFSPVLARAFPGARFVHATRSGLDTAASLQARTWAPDDPCDCLLFWHERLRRASLAARSLPSGRLVTLDLAQFGGSERAREDALARLVDFVGGGAEPMRAFLEDEIRASQARPGSWRERIEPAEHERFVALYRRLVADLRRSGVVPPSDDLGSGELRSGRGRRSLLAAWTRYRIARWKLWDRRAWAWRRPRWRRVVSRLPGRGR